MIEVITSPTHVRIGEQEAIQAMKTARLGLSVLALTIGATALVLSQKLKPRLK